MTYKKLKVKTRTFSSDLTGLIMKRLGVVIAVVSAAALFTFYKNKTIKFEVANARKKKKGVEEIFLLLTKSHGRSIINEFITNGKKKSDL